MHETIKLDAEKYQDFTAEKYPYSLNFYDFEVFVHSNIPFVNRLINRGVGLARIAVGLTDKGETCDGNPMTVTPTPVLTMQQCK